MYSTTTLPESGKGVDAVKILLEVPLGFDFEYEFDTSITPRYRDKSIKDSASQTRKGKTRGIDA